MIKVKNKHRKIFFLIIAILIAFSVVFFLSLQQTGTVKYISEDLKISFNYPNRWYVDEKDYDIILASYQTEIGDNSRPNSEQIKIFIDKFNIGCHQDIEKDLMDPACGEGGPEVPLNEIVSKETEDLPGGTFYKYIIKSPTSDEEFTFYLLENGDRILQISKEPDPSAYEEEFEEIIKSIRFL
ncbi:MAG: hypothetical protein A3A51_03970 [Candidatus Levybacteria bacterium RIFCSPLOWO2_01_FULL_39_10]|nr:MAG: hypothetical protein A3A51_03970 [Candidatus Levybacteria bacterium RIFCSPLOWO2_01_FULL_39_10]